MTTKERWELPFHSAVPRVGDPGRVYSVTDARGVTRSIRADANGRVWPLSPEDVQLADVNGLKVASDWTFPTVAAVPDAAAEATLDDLTVAQLRERAEAMGLDIPARATKPVLVSAIEAATADAEVFLATATEDGDDGDDTDDESDEDFPTDQDE